LIAKHLTDICHITFKKKYIAFFKLPYKYIHCIINILYSVTSVSVSHNKFLFFKVFGKWQDSYM